MKAFLQMVRASVQMLRRNTALILSSLGLSVISVFAFGLLFGPNGNVKPILGIVDEDHTALSAQITDQLRNSRDLNVSTASRSTELDALRSGHRNAIIVLPVGFSAALQQGNATIPVYYDQSNPTSWLIARISVQQIVTNISGVKLPIALSEQAISVRDLRQIDFLTPGLLGMMLMWANLGVGTILVTWRQQGIMRRLAATPLRPLALIGSQMVARLILSVGQGALLLIIAALAFHVQIVGSMLLLALVVILGTLTMLSIGFIIGSFAKSAEVANAITFLISFPMMFLGGSYFSVDNAPDFMKPVTQALPLTHLNDALRQIINNGASFATIQTDVFILAAWAVVGVLLATRAFRWS